MRLNKEDLLKLSEVDVEAPGAYVRYLYHDAELQRLTENRDIANDYVDDTLSLDKVIAKVTEYRDEAVARLHWAGEKAGITVNIPFMG